MANLRMTGFGLAVVATAAACTPYHLPDEVREYNLKECPSIAESGKNAVMLVQYDRTGEAAVVYACNNNGAQIEKRGEEGREKLSVVNKTKFEVEKKSNEEDPQLCWYTRDGVRWCINY